MRKRAILATFPGRGGVFMGWQPEGTGSVSKACHGLPIADIGRK